MAKPLFFVKYGNLLQKNCNMQKSQVEGFTIKNKSSHTQTHEREDELKNKQFNITLETSNMACKVKTLRQN